jgi:hypothetical protein
MAEWLHSRMNHNHMVMTAAGQCSQFVVQGWLPLRSCTWAIGDLQLCDHRYVSVAAASTLSADRQQGLGLRCAPCQAVEGEAEELRHAAGVDGWDRWHHHLRFK